MTSSPHCETRLWLLRHSEPSVEIRGRCYGRLDAGLSEEGKRQAAQVASALSEEPIQAIFSSPSLRAQESAGALAGQHGLPLQLDRRFREIDFGDFEGMSYDEIARTNPDLYKIWMEHPTQVAFPNGESFTSMKERVLLGAKDLLRSYAGKTIALFSHGGVNRILIAHFLGMPEENLFRIGQGYAAQNLIVQIDDAYLVELVNRLPDE